MRTGRTKLKNYYVLEVYRDVEPALHGPYGSESRRDLEARRLREKEREGENGLFWLNVTAGGDATVGCYSQAELDDNP